MTVATAGIAGNREESLGSLDLEWFLPYRLSVLANRVSRALAVRYRHRFGLSIPEWRVLAVLGRDGRLSAGDIAARTSMDKVKVSRAIAALLRKGLVRRQRDPRDRRVTRIEPTESGREVYGAVARLALSWQEEWLGRLGAADRERLWQLLDRLESSLSALEELPEPSATVD
ncbi:Multidrug resistance operon repressor [bacterium HR40]|nr:Multidrug resistance operon repressor [bacterium HR40]